MRNQRGIAEAILLLYIIGGLVLFFVPNPLSSAVGIGIRPNKTVQTEKVELIKDKDGNPIAYKTTTSDKDIQQHIGFFEWLRSLPFLVILFMVLGIFFPGIAAWRHKAWIDLQAETKRIVVSVDKALSIIKDDAIKKQVMDELSKAQDQSTKDLVDKIQGK